MFRVLARRSLVQRGAKVLRGGDGPRMLPFARLAPPTEKVIYVFPFYYFTDIFADARAC
jgi:hypothetical protein